MNSGHSQHKSLFFFFWCKNIRFLPNVNLFESKIVNPFSDFTTHSEPMSHHKHLNNTTWLFHKYFKSMIISSNTPKNLSPWQLGTTTPVIILYGYHSYENTLFWHVDSSLFYGNCSYQDTTILKFSAHLPIPNLKAKSIYRKHYITIWNVHIVC